MEQPILASTEVDKFLSPLETICCEETNGLPEVLLCPVLHLGVPVSHIFLDGIVKSQSRAASSAITPFRCKCQNFSKDCFICT